MSSVLNRDLTLPGLLIVCGDSHTSTHGAFGAYAFGIGASEVAHVLMTQTLWQKRPKRMRISVDGTATVGVGAKTSLSQSSRMSAPTERKATPSSLAGALSAHCPWKGA